MCVRVGSSTAWVTCCGAHMQTHTYSNPKKKMRGVIICGFLAHVVLGFKVEPSNDAWGIDTLTTRLSVPPSPSVAYSVVGPLQGGDGGRGVGGGGHGGGAGHGAT